MDAVEENVYVEMPHPSDPLHDTVQRFMTHRHTSRCSRRGDGRSYDYPFEQNAQPQVVDTGARPRLLYQRRDAVADADVVSYNTRVLAL